MLMERTMDFFNDLTVVSLEQATVLPYLTYRLAQDGMNVIRLEHPVYGDPNRFIGENGKCSQRKTDELLFFVHKCGQKSADAESG
jgi:crotonobetainyl-CoA:carnitine CoA-transferase CaiB-like acyl-CoA transferase